MNAAASPFLRRPRSAVPYGVALLGLTVACWAVARAAGADVTPAVLALPPIALALRANWLPSTLLAGLAGILAGRLPMATVHGYVAQPLEVWGLRLMVFVALALVIAIATSRTRRSEAMYRTLVESLPAATYFDEIRADGQRSLYASPQIEAILGYPTQRWRASGFWESIIHPEDRDRVLEEDARTNRSGEPFEREYRVIARDGRTVWLHDRSVLFERGPGGNQIWLGFQIDVTQRRAAEEELRRTLDLLRRTDRDRGRLLSRLIRSQEEERERIAADIHDDTIQAMAAAAMRLDLLRMRHPELDDDERTRKLSEDVHAAIGRLRNLMFELHPRSLGTAGLAACIRDLLRREHEGAPFCSSVDDRIADEPPDELRLVLYRIAREAVANVRKHARATNVSVSLEQTEHAYRVRIVDDGVGFHIDREAESRMRLHVGLASMRDRAETAGGGCRVLSEPGGGTTVEFWVPVPAGTDGPCVAVAGGAPLSA